MKGIYKKWLCGAAAALLLLGLAGCAATGEESASRDNASAKLTTLGAGEFTVGTDVPVGRYVVSPGEGESGNFFVYEGELPTENEILGGDLGVPTVTLDLKKDQTVKISSLKTVTFTPAETALSTKLTCGTWKVGLDIEAGKYVAAPKEGESGNFFVYDGALPTTNEILGGDMGVPNVTVTLKKGQVIKISSISEVSFERQ